MCEVPVLPSHAERELDGELQTVHHSARVRPVHQHHMQQVTGINNTPPFLDARFHISFLNSNGCTCCINYSCGATEVALYRMGFHSQCHVSTRHTQTHTHTHSYKATTHCQWNLKWLAQISTKQCSDVSYVRHINVSSSSGC